MKHALSAHSPLHRQLHRNDRASDVGRMNESKKKGSLVHNFTTSGFVAEVKWCTRMVTFYYYGVLSKRDRERWDKGKDNLLPCSFLHSIGFE